jgi:hypothetical protein
MILTRAFDVLGFFKVKLLKNLEKHFSINECFELLLT